jgi:hypothetical protein
MAEVVHNNISLPMPMGWEDGTQVVIVAPEAEGGFRPNVVMSRDPPEPPDETPQAFSARHQRALRSALERYELLDEHDHRRVGPYDGFLREHAFLANAQRLQQFQYYFRYEGWVYTLTFTHLASHFPEWRARALEIFAKLRFTET